MPGAWSLEKRSPPRGVVGCPLAVASSPVMVRAGCPERRSIRRHDHGQRGGHDRDDDRRPPDHGAVDLDEPPRLRGDANLPGLGPKDVALATLAEVFLPQRLPATQHAACLLYTSDAADDLLCVDLGGR